MLFDLTEREIAHIQAFRGLTENCQLSLEMMAKNGRKYYPPKVLAQLERRHANRAFASSGDLAALPMRR